MNGIILNFFAFILISSAKSAPIDQSFTELQTRVYTFFSKDNFIQESYNLTWRITEDMRIGDELVSEELVIEVPKESQLADHSKEHTLRRISTPIFALILMTNCNRMIIASANHVIVFRCGHGLKSL